jgi:DNA ligase (NAD+)
MTSEKPIIPAWQFFAALGIPTAGKSAGKELIRHFASFDAILDVTTKQLLEVEGVGERTAEAICQYLHKNRGEILDILKWVDLELPKTGKLSGKNFCLSGTLEQGKKHWVALIEEQGGVVTDSVGKSTTYLVAGPGSVGKSDKAAKLGVPILSEKDLEKILK